MRRDTGDTSARHRTGVQMSTKLASITLRAREDSKCKFTSLAHVLTEDFLKDCFYELKRDKAPGIDGVSVRGYEDSIEENIKELVTRLKAKRYKPQPVRRACIPKSDGTKRGLGVPAVEDKIVQTGIKKILEAVFEADFIDVSFGFRPKRSCHEALGFTHYCDKTRNGKFKSGRKTTKIKFRQKMKAMNEWIKEVRNLVKLNEWWKVLRLKLLGHYRCYGMSGNMRELRKFYIQTSKLAYKWINRRSQKKSCTYKQYCQFKKYNPLPEPKIYHLTYTLSSC